MHKLWVCKVGMYTCTCTYMLVIYVGTPKLMDLEALTQ